MTNDESTQSFESRPLDTIIQQQQGQQRQWSSNNNMSDMSEITSPTLFSEQQRLAFPNKLYRREKELEILYSVMESVCFSEDDSKNNAAQLVAVHGDSGCGKSRLVQELQTRIASTRLCDGYFVVGKFDQFPSNEQDTILSGLSDIVHMIIQSDDKEARAAKILQALFDSDENVDLYQLCQLIPFISILMPPTVETTTTANDADGESTSPSLSSSSSTSMMSLDVACKLFVKAVACQDHPLVLFFDDVHWASHESWLILKAMMAQSDLKHVLFILSFRTNEMSISTLRRHVKGLKVPLTTIEVGPLDNLQPWIIDLLGLEQHAPSNDSQKDNNKDEEQESQQDQQQQQQPKSIDNNIQQLATVVLNKTGGNPFHFIKFMQHLQDYGLIIRSRGGTWTWDMERIQAETSVSPNVVELVVDTLERLPPTVRALMAVASFLGHQFRVELFQDVVKGLLKLLVNTQRQQQQQQQQTMGSDNKNNNSTIGTPPRIIYGLIPLFRSTSNMANDNVDDDIVSDSLQDALGLAVQAFLVEMWRSKIKFTHDRIQKTCRNIVLYYEEEDNKNRDRGTLKKTRMMKKRKKNTEQRDRLHLWIGRILLELSQRKDANLLFHAADHLNRGGSYIESLKNKLGLAELNLRVARIAVGSSVFSTAAKHLRASLRILTTLEQENDDDENDVPTQQCWNEHYKICLDVCISLAEMEYNLGNLSVCDKLTDTILNHVHDDSVVEKLRASYLKIISVGAQGKYNDAIALGFELLDDLEVKFPQRRRPTAYHLMLESAKAKRSLGSMSDEKLLKLPIMRNPRHLCVMKVLAAMALFFSSAAQMTDIKFSLIVFRAIQFTCSNGLCEASPFAFSLYALHFIVQHGDVEQATRFGRLAMQLLDKMKSQNVETRTLVVLHQFVLVWKTGITIASAEILSRGFFFRRRGPLLLPTSSGGSEFGYYGAYGVLMCSWLCGNSLEEAREYGSRFYHDLKESKTPVLLGQRAMTLPCYQAILNLMGDNNNNHLLQLTGDAMNQDDMMGEITSSENAKDNNTCLEVINTCRLMLAVTFGIRCSDMTTLDLKDLIASVERGQKYLSSHFSIVFARFFLGLALVDLHGQVGQGKYKRLARQSLKQLQTWARQGFVTSGALAMLLQAELDHASSPPTSYAQAIDICQRLELKGFEAMANERAAMAYRRINNTSAAQVFMTRALDLFNEWCAFAKAEQLEIHHHELLYPNDHAGAGANS